MNNQTKPDPTVQAPHVPLMEYYADEQARKGFVREIFDSTAGDYDRMENILGLGTGMRYRGQAMERAGLKTGMRVVDVGVGTGLVAREAVRITGDARLVTGVQTCALPILRRCDKNFLLIYPTYTALQNEVSV